MSELFSALRQKLSKVHWLAVLYRKLVLKLPSSVCYLDVLNTQQQQLASILGENNDTDTGNSVVSIVVDIRGGRYSRLDFERLAQSLDKQTLNRWEMLLLTDRSCSFTHEKHSSKMHSLHVDEHIALRDVLENINGEYVCLLSCPVVFNNYLVEAVSQFSQQEDVIYCDHDFRLNDEQPANHNLKPQWNPDLFLSNDYLGEACFINRTQLEQRAGTKFEFLYQAKQDCLLSDVYSQKVKHIPYVLMSYTELNLQTQQAETLYRAQRLAQNFPQAEVSVGLTEYSHRIKWPLPADKPLVSIIIPTRNGRDLVECCIESINNKTSYTNYEVILVDNQSDKPQDLAYFKQLESEQKIRLLDFDDEFNYSAINNMAVTNARGDVIVFMNNDIEVLSSEWLDEMVSQALREEIGCVGAKLYYPNDTLQHGGVIVGLWDCAGHSHKSYERNANGYMNRLKLVQNYSAVTAACLAIRKDVFIAVGGFNEQDLQVSFNDVDLCLKVEQYGLHNLWTPYSEHYHHESISRGPENTPEKKAREQREIAYMRSTWDLVGYHDPAYNPWLTRTKEDFSIGNLS